MDDQWLNDVLVEKGHGHHLPTVFLRGLRYRLSTSGGCIAVGKVCFNMSWKQQWTRTCCYFSNTNKHKQQYFSNHNMWKEMAQRATRVRSCERNLEFSLSFNSGTQFEPERSQIGGSPEKCGIGHGGEIPLRSQPAYVQLWPWLPVIIIINWLFLWDYTFPICSMYGIFTYIYPTNGPNVGKYTIHGASGFYKWGFVSTYNWSMAFFPVVGSDATLHDRPLESGNTVPGDWDLALYFNICFRKLWHQIGWLVVQ